MDKTIKIAGDLTIGDWIELKACLEFKIDNDQLWEKAYVFLEKRINSRYLEPIEAIEQKSNIEGSGFAIAAILCSIIEALESFYQGRTYRKPTRENPLNETTEYYKSQPIFESFLKNREPFKHYFSENGMATEFYENVRCALLHEAATRNGWKLRIDTKNLIERKEKLTILNRELFVKNIKNYLQRYKKELITNTKLKEAFIRKFDSICQTA